MRAGQDQPVGGRHGQLGSPSPSHHMLQPPQRNMTHLPKHHSKVSSDFPFGGASQHPTGAGPGSGQSSFVRQPDGFGRRGEFG